MITEIERFLQVVEKGSISKAADSLFMTQSALTQSLQRLEKELGIKLFVTKGKKISITEEGKSVTILGKDILKLWKTAHDPELLSQKTPIYKIGMYDNAAYRLKELISKHLNTKTHQIDLTIASSGQLLKQLSLGVLDLAVIVSPLLPIRSHQIKQVATYQEKLIPVCSRTLTMNVEEIPFILYNQPSHTRLQIDQIFRDHGIVPKIYAESTSTTFMKELALLGSGVAVLPLSIIQSELKDKTLKKISIPVTFTRDFAVYENTSGELARDTALYGEILEMLAKK